MQKLLTLFLVLGFFTVGALAQKSSALVGEVTAVDAAANRLTIKTNDGEIIVGLDAKTEFKRVSPDKPTDLAAATVSSQSEVGVGDRVIAVGVLSEDKKSVAQARRVILMTKSDIASKQKNESEKWQTRGIAGRVTAVNPTAGEITVSQRGGFGGERAVAVKAADKTVFHRYAPNSVKFSDARTSSLGEVKVGDQLRALGEKSADGGQLTAEEIIFGSFRMVVGKIIAIDTAKNEITVKDLQSNNDVVVAVNADSQLRRFPAEMAQRMAQMQMMRAAGGGQTPNGGGQGGQPGARPNRENQPTGEPGGGQGAGQQRGGGMRGGRGDLDTILEQMPVLSVAELKVGDAVAASSSEGASPNRVTAIKFVAGVEPFLTAPQIPGGNRGGNRGQGGSPSFNIPGLDGFDAPSN